MAIIDGLVTENDELYQLIEQRTGLVLSEQRRSDIQKYLVKQGENTHQSLLSLQKAPLTDPAWQTLIDTLTVCETYFFRNAPHFQALRTKILPELIEQRRASRHLRIWVAGCATGEEAYSIAILLRELIPDIAQWNIFLLATDINSFYLKRAQQAVYSSRSFRNDTPAYVQTRWFTAEKDGYHLDPLIQKMVVFQSLNLVDDLYPSFSSGTNSLDLILCRNVTIYFDRPTTQKVVDRFYQSIVEKGWLIVGHAEPQAEVYDAFTVKHLDNAIFYQKEIRQSPRPSSPFTFHIEVKPEVSAVPMPKPVRTPVGKTAPLQPITQDAWLEASKAADAGQWDEAQRWLTVLEQQNRAAPELHYLRALVYIHLEDIDAAIASLRQTIYLNQEFILAHYTLGELHAKRGNKDEARRCWKRAQALVSRLDSSQLLLGANDLTAEMLNGLLIYQLGRLTKGL